VRIKEIRQNRVRYGYRGVHVPAQTGYHGAIRVDQGSEFVSRDIALWAYAHEVTLDFNTTTSMGRLTLNVLLSFAQFEREVIGERIHDKVAASKKKGIWMGEGCPWLSRPRPKAAGGSGRGRDRQADV
jgi:DNA invertase Pin-like site-specific DNA recombinase